LPFDVEVKSWELFLKRDVLLEVQLQWLIVYISRTAVFPGGVINSNWVRSGCPFWSLVYWSLHSRGVLWNGSFAELVEGGTIIDALNCHILINLIFLHLSEPPFQANGEDRTDERVVGYFAGWAVQCGGCIRECNPKSRPSRGFKCGATELWTGEFEPVLQSFPRELRNSWSPKCRDK
jgi:hypothetical protein